MRRSGLPLACLIGLVAAAAPARTVYVCADNPGKASCDHAGPNAIQDAVDAAAAGDLLILRAGTYRPASFRDVAFQDVIVRGFVAIDSKRLTIRGEDGAVLDGSQGVPSSAFVLRRADVSIENLGIAGFRFALEEDKIYDGHGLFAIDSRVRLRDVAMKNIPKMSLTGRGETMIDACGLSILDGHVGVWLEESARARLRDGVIRGGDSAAVAAYGDSSAALAGMTIADNQDDGLYVEDRAAISITRSVISGNRPFALNGKDQGRIRAEHSLLHANAADVNPALPRDRFQLGPGIRRGAPRAGASVPARCGGGA